MFLFVWLCELCSLDVQCGGDADLCVFFEDIVVCVVDCGEDGACFIGYVCDSVVLVDGGLLVVVQCVLKSGVCFCSVVNVGTVWECVCLNGYGICVGMEICVVDQGWVGCSVLEFVVEVCDGEDNNCDGVVDEGFLDIDGDGLLDCYENDVDKDGMFDGFDNCLLKLNADQVDLDKDELGDACDLDDDGDNVFDGIDNCLIIFNLL